jgi:hypothetical protein
MIRCRDCGHESSEPSVGFLCLDCGAHADGDQIEAIDIYNYGLTERAIAILETGQHLLGDHRNALHLGELPLELIVALNGELDLFKGDRKPFTLLEISYRKEREIETEHGAHQFEQARDFFLENLRHALARDDKVVKGHAYDYALLPGIELKAAHESLDAIRKQATASVRLDLGVTISAFRPEQLA